jgi:serine/threonine protein kinase/tetratricopeptide (TPR) repeat protein
MKQTLEDRWREISPYLDELLDLEPEQRQQWLAALETRDPVIARHLRVHLHQLDTLDREDFLGSPPLVMMSASLAGQQFGAYTLDVALGHGGMGSVWLAHRSDGRFEGQAAVKLLSPMLVGHPFEKRFASEGSVLARLQHPNIARLLDAGVAAAGSQPYLVLEYVPGEHIDQYCERRNLDLRRRIVLFLDVLAAVTHAHSNLIVHRDIKPPNVLVTEAGSVKLLDFGIATLLSSADERATHLTFHVALGLTPAYAAPEQLRGEPVTTATDVYALGLLLFLLLAGTHPFAREEEASAASLMQAILAGDVPRPSEHARDPRQARQLRGDLDNIVAMALRLNPTERYATVDQFAQDLRRYLAVEPVSARPRSMWYLTTMFVRRHRAGVALAAAVVVMLIVAVAVTTLEMVEARAQRAEAQEQRDRVRTQSLRAEAFGGFLQLLMLTDPGPTRSVRTLHDRLELGVELIDKQYRDDPKFASRMLVELGEFFRDNQDIQRSNELFQRGYDLARGQHDAEAMAYAQCSRARGEAQSDSGAGVQARLAEARQLLAQLEHPDAELQALCLMAEGAVEQRLDHDTVAEADLRRAIHLMEADGSTHRMTYTAVLTDLGGIYLARSQPRQALPLIQLVGEIHDRNGRGGTTMRLTTRQNAATLLDAMGEFSAELRERQIIQQRLIELSDLEQQPLYFQGNYALVLAHVARPEEALRVLDGILDRARHVGHPAQLAQTLYARGSILVQLQRWDEADAVLREAASLASGGLGNSNLAALIEWTQARLGFARGDLQSAQAHLQKSLQLSGYHTPKPGRALPKVLLTASQFALAQGNTTDAEQFAQDGLRIYEAIARGPETSADVGEALLRLAQARLRAGSHPETKQLLERAVRCLSNGLTADHPLTLEAQRVLSEVSVAPDVPAGSPSRTRR